MWKKFILTLSIAFIFTGCLDHSNKIVLKSMEKGNFEAKVNEIEKRFNKCYFREFKGIIPGRYVVREDLKNPRHSRLYLFLFPNSPILPNILGTITVIEKKDGIHKVVINDRELIAVRRIKEWYENGMKCDEENN